MATFADMATLLMAFFVLILSFAQMNVPKFKVVCGSLKNAFGVQRMIPTVEPPLARNIVAEQYKNARAGSDLMRVIQEQTTDEPQPIDPELKTDVKSLTLKPMLMWRRYRKPGQGDSRGQSYPTC